MDFWVVAAATGAGYVAKNWQNLSGEKDSPSKLLPVLSPRVQPDTCQVLGKMPNSVFPLPKLARSYSLEDVSSPEEHNSVGMDLCNHNKLLVSDSTSIFIKERVFQDNMNEINEKRKCLDFPGHHVNGFRAKNTNVKSFSSLRPLMATQVNDMNDKIELTEENGAFFEPAGLVKLPRRQKEMYVEKFERRDLYPQGKEMVPLFLGITIGILSTTVTIQREVEDLNDLLEQAENMVKDLHNKLETKDGFTTKEHGTEADVTATASPKAKNLDLTSDIEAELEAELERLEENMKDCTLQRLHNVVEIDSDYEADMARGNLNLDALPWRSESLSESDHSDKHNESESTSKRIFTPNYAVSSLDLRLRLHEVIESELRARIEELEAVLKNQNSQSKPSSPKGPEPQEENSFWDFDHTRIESSSSTP